MPISTTKPGSLGDNNPLITASQTQRGVNSQMTTVAGVQNGKQAILKNGDSTIAISGDNIYFRQGAAKGTALEFNISRASTGLKPYQTGTIAPSVATNFPADGDFGFYENTTGPTYYWTINHGGALKNISISTLTGWPIAFPSITGTITADQHGELGRTTSGGSTHPLHTNATTGEAGFLSTTFFDLLTTTSVTTSNDSLVKRSATGAIQASAFNAVTAGSTPGTFLVDGSNIATADSAYSTSLATANTLVRRAGSAACNFGPLVCTTLGCGAVTGTSTISGTVITSSSSSFVSGSTQVVGAQGAIVADATNATDVITQLNTLLARVRVHGLIAT